GLLDKGRGKAASRDTTVDQSTLSSVGDRTFASERTVGSDRSEGGTSSAARRVQESLGGGFDYAGLRGDLLAVQEARNHLREAELEGEESDASAMAPGGGASANVSFGTGADLSEIRALVSSRIHDAARDLTLLHESAPAGTHPAGAPAAPSDGHEPGGGALKRDVRERKGKEDKPAARPAMAFGRPVTDDRRSGPGSRLARGAGEQPAPAARPGKPAAATASATPRARAQSARAAPDATPVAARRVPESLGGGEETHVAAVRPAVVGTRRTTTRPSSAASARPAVSVTRHHPPVAPHASSQHGHSGGARLLDLTNDSLLAVSSFGGARVVPPAVAVVAAGRRKLLSASSASLLASRPAPRRMEGEAWGDDRTKPRRSATTTAHFSATVDVHQGEWGAESERHLALQLAAVLSVTADQISVKTIGVERSRAQVEVRVVAGASRDALKLEQQLGASARDPSSELWAFTDMARLSVGGETFEKTVAHGSPPRQDILAPDAGRGVELSPQLAASEWEEVAAPMEEMRETSQEVLGIAPQIVGPATAKASAARSISFDEAGGSSSLTSGGQSATGGAWGGDEEAVVRSLMGYLTHHLMARVEVAATARGAAEEEGEGHRFAHDANVCSPLAARILGAKGLMLLMDAGADVEDEAVVGIAAEMLEEEARRAFSTFKDIAAHAHDDPPAPDPDGMDGARLFPHVRDVRTALTPFGGAPVGAVGGAAPRSDDELERLVLGLLLEALAHPEDPGVAPAAPGEPLSAVEEGGGGAAGGMAGGLLAPAAHPRRPASPRTLGALSGRGGALAPFAGPGSAGGAGGAVVEAAGAVEQREQMAATLLRIASSMDTLTTLTQQMAAREPPAYMPATPWSH
ncbi:hypothetical protein T484DRAFT_1778374, partial [Baffinella frigidus]